MHTTTHTDPAEILIVSGLPRSGTSLMMRMLDAAGVPPLTDGQRRPDDDNPLGYYEFEAVKRLRHDSSWLDAAAGKAVKVIHILLPDLPSTRRYRVLFMRRDMDEVVASQRKMLERLGRSGAALSTDALKAQFETQLRAVDAWVDSRPNIARLDVSYNDLLREPGPVVTRTASFIGRPDREREMLAAIDSGLYRNRKR